MIKGARTKRHETRHTKRCQYVGTSYPTSYKDVWNMLDIVSNNTNM